MLANSSTLRRLILLLLILPALLFSGSALAATPVTIDYMQWGDAIFDKIELEVIAAFERTHPHIKVNLLSNAYTGYKDKFVTMLAGGTVPDVALVDGFWYHEFAAKGLIMDVTDWMKRDRFSSDQIHPAFWEEMNIDGRFYSVANSRSGRIIMYYNKTKFAEAGAPDPYQIEWNWSNFEQVLKRLTKDLNGDGQADYWGLERGALNNWQPFVWSNGGEFTNREKTMATFSNPKTVEALQWLSDLRYSLGVVGGWFKTDKTCAMYSNWDTSDINFWRTTADFEWDVAQPPAGPAGQVTVVKGNMIVIPVDSPHPKEAWEFMKFLAGEEAQYIYGMNARFFPSHRRAGLRVINDTRGKAPAHLLTLLDIKARPLPLSPKFSDFQTMYNRELGKLWSGTEPAKVVAERMDELAKSILGQ